MQLVTDQIERDTNLQDLARQMISLYKRAYEIGNETEGGPSKLQDRPRDILLRVALQANDCVYFIRDYCKDEKLGTSL